MDSDQVGSAHDAIQSVTELYNQGYHYVVDLDLKAYFDTVNHDLTNELHQTTSN